MDFRRQAARLGGRRQRDPPVDTARAGRRRAETGQGHRRPHAARHVPRSIHRRRKATALRQPRRHGAPLGRGSKPPGAPDGSRRSRPRHRRHAERQDLRIRRRKFRAALECGQRRAARRDERRSPRPRANRPERAGARICEERSRVLENHLGDRGKKSDRESGGREESDGCDPICGKSDRREKIRARKNHRRQTQARSRRRREIRGDCENESHRRPRIREACRETSGAIRDRREGRV